ncbi:MAG: hypothetical protein ACOX6Y_00220 [Christensenellales bacterium]
MSRALTEWGEMVCAVVLAVSLEEGKPLEGAFTQSWDINGKNATLSVVRVLVLKSILSEDGTFMLNLLLDMFRP